jgi:hypothetical protein
MQYARSYKPTDGSADRTWIPCSEKLPHATQYVLYCTAHYQALGKRERERWYRSAFDLELEENPVLCWRPVVSN